MQLEDWLDDLCVRFIINLPPEELDSVERICFQVEEAQWFYEDFIRPLDPSLPSLTLRAFSLRIFQHCPLFSQWSAQHHISAFEEFLAYKSRVPVRGAIMLNEAMDEVVLVKGWKKSANWSFPRGKINKDENDLDCAIREVYEETGFDLRSEGLAKDEKDMKYIEVTMREQHMRLYVFRGVPRDAKFEPKTRKEISKIEWYKLTDLPTLKKSRQHEASGPDKAHFNANKFYMVAPFLNPLKKWIVQQRKKESRYSSHLAAPPMVPEEATTDGDQDTNGVTARLSETTPQAVSDLPEVSDPRAVDASSHLKEILKIGPSQAVHPEATRRPSHMALVDTEKSNALLALLRSGPPGQSRAVPHTPFEQISQEAQLQPSPHVSHLRSSQIDQVQPPPPFQAQLQHQFRSPGLPIQSRLNESPTSFHQASGLDQKVHQIAPYQRTGDPLFAQQGRSQQQHSIVPPASALPKLTNHTKALLDVFKGAPSQPSGPASVNPGLLNLLTGTDTSDQSQDQRQNVQANAQFQPNQADQRQTRGDDAFAPKTSFQPTVANNLQAQVSSLLSARHSARAQQSSLLDLFNSASKPGLREGSGPKVTAPVELAATAAVTSNQKPPAKKDEILLALLRQGGQEVPRNASEPTRPSPREGETAATISGPLNQPEFEALSRATRQMTNEMGRSPLTGNRTLFDPKQPAPIKILTRPEEARPQPPKSPRASKAVSKRPGKEKAPPKEPSKPFQPQILRRPQAGEASEASPAPTASEAVTQQARLFETASPPPVSDDVGEALTTNRKPSQTEAQRQTLLALFGGASDSTPKLSAAQPGSGIVSPLSSSQIISANAEIPVSGIDSFSTRTSRVGSLASLASGAGPGRAPSEKRQTGAENKAFLLGYLGRIANQES